MFNSRIPGELTIDCIASPVILQRNKQIASNYSLHIYKNMKYVVAYMQQATFSM